MRVSGISFKSAYISDNLQNLLSGQQKVAIYNLGNSMPLRHIIASATAPEANADFKQILFRINDAISAKELTRLYMPLAFEPDRLLRLPRYIFKA